MHHHEHEVRLFKTFSERELLCVGCGQQFERFKCVGVRHDKDDAQGGAGPDGGTKPGGESSGKVSLADVEGASAGWYRYRSLHRVHRDGFNMHPVHDDELDDDDCGGDRAHLLNEVHHRGRCG